MHISQESPKLKITQIDKIKIQEDIQITLIFNFGQIASRQTRAVEE